MSHGKGTGIVVVVRPGEPFENVLRRFKRKVKRERIILNYRDREFYTKPSEIRRRERRIHKARMRTAMKEENQQK